MVNGALARKNISVLITSERENILQIQMIHNILIIGLNKLICFVKPNQELGLWEPAFSLESSLPHLLCQLGI